MGDEGVCVVDLAASVNTENHSTDEIGDQSVVDIAASVSTENHSTTLNIDGQGDKELASSSWRTDTEWHYGLRPDGTVGKYRKIGSKRTRKGINNQKAQDQKNH